MRREKKFILSILTAVILLSLISCRGAITGDPQVRLKERVEGYIEARKAGDQIALQAFFLDPHQAKVGNIRYLSTEIIGIDFSDEGKKAEVQLKNDLKAMGFTFKDTPQSTEWVWQKDDWYQVVNPNKNPFTRPANQLKKSSHVDAQK